MWVMNRGFVWSPPPPVWGRVVQCGGAELAECSKRFEGRGSAPDQPALRGIGSVVSTAGYGRRGSAWTGKSRQRRHRFRRRAGRGSARFGLPLRPAVADAGRGLRPVGEVWAAPGDSAARGAREGGCSRHRPRRATCRLQRVRRRVRTGRPQGSRAAGMRGMWPGGACHRDLPDRGLRYRAATDASEG